MLWTRNPAAASLRRHCSTAPWLATSSWRSNFTPNRTLPTAAWALSYARSMHSGSDPARKWKGPWRWFSEELLDCCKPLEEIRRLGLSLDEVACLARCSGTHVALHRPGLETGVERFRAQVLEASTRDGASLLIVNYSRRALGQSGDGHFSPLGGYHADSDCVLVLDTARFKYPPHWVPLELLFTAMQAYDSATGLPRGWLGLQRSPPARSA